MFKGWKVYDSSPKTIKCPLVCLPPASGTSDIFFKQILGLAAKGYRVISASIQNCSTTDWVRFLLQFYSTPLIFLNNQKTSIVLHYNLQLDSKKFQIRNIQAILLHGNTKKSDTLTPDQSFLIFWKFSMNFRIILWTHIFRLSRRCIGT